MTGMEIVISPFSDDQMNSINTFQKADKWHPFTCPKCRSRLKASRVALQCYGCGKWLQSWAYRFMTDWSWQNPRYYLAEFLAQKKE